MKTVSFRKFLEENDLKISVLPKSIQDKIDLFSKLHDFIGRIEESDDQELQDQLEDLDYEILMDIQSEYQDRLENNERLEKLATSPTLKKSFKKKAVARLRTDATILEEFVKMGRTQNIGRSELQEIGIKAPLKRDVVIGSYMLKRVSRLFHRYDIIPLKK